MRSTVLTIRTLSLQIANKSLCKGLLPDEKRGKQVDLGREGCMEASVTTLGRVTLRQKAMSSTFQAKENGKSSQ